MRNMCRKIQVRALSNFPEKVSKEKRGPGSRPQINILPCMGRRVHRCRILFPTPYFPWDSEKTLCFFGEKSYFSVNLRAGFLLLLRNRTCCFVALGKTRLFISMLISLGKFQSQILQPPFLLRYLLSLDSLLRLEILYFRRKIQLIFPGSVCAQILYKFQGCIRNFSIFPFHTFFLFFAAALQARPKARSCHHFPRN